MDVFAGVQFIGSKLSMSFAFSVGGPNLPNPTIPTPRSPLPVGDRLICNYMVGKLTWGLAKINATGQIIPKGPVMLAIGLMKPRPMDCAELDCDGNGIPDFDEFDKINICSFE